MEILEAITLKRKDSIKPVTKGPDKEPVHFVEFLAKVKILDLPKGSIISAGFECIAHHDAKEYYVTVDKIQGKPFLKIGDNALIKFHSKTEMSNTQTRFVIRSAKKTIGFGMIVKVKGVPPFPGA